MYFEFTGLKDAIAHGRAAAKKRVPYVANTWLNRDQEHQIRDLAAGLIAQAVLEVVFTEQGLPYISYDATRTDDYRKNDPFDFILLPPGYREGHKLIGWLQRDIYPLVNSQGRLKGPDRLVLKDRLKREGALIADLKSSVDNRRHGIEKVIDTQHFIAYATQKNDKGFREMTGPEYLREIGYSADEYITEKKQTIRDAHFRVWFADPDLRTAYYAGFTPGKDLLLRGTVGPMPGTPWVAYHKLPIIDGEQPGTERAKLFPRR